MCLYFICRSRGWLAKMVSWPACIVFLVGVSVPLAIWAWTDQYKWPRAGNGRLAIVNAHIVSLGKEPSSGELVDGDAVLVEGGRITGVVSVAQVGPDWPKLDAAGAYLLPGLIDVHAHLFAPVRSVEAQFNYRYMVECFFSGLCSPPAGVLGERNHRDPRRWWAGGAGVRVAGSDSRSSVVRAAAICCGPQGHPVATIWKPFPALVREGAVLADGQQSLSRGLEKNYREGPPDAVKFIYGTIGLAPQLLAPELLRTGIAW